MKRLQQLSIAVVLSLLFSVSTFAGDIGMPKASPPPPDPTSETIPTQTPKAGTSSSGFASSDCVTLTVMNLLQEILSVF
jgi:hypothetical protein